MRFYKEQSELFEGIQNGDADAFEYVFKTYYPRLRNYANRFVSDSDDLEDILQNCFIHLWERRDSITFISISSLLFTMVRNGCLNYFKHQALVNGYEIGSLNNIPGAEELYSTDMKGTTDSDTLYNELTRQIEQVMEELSPRCRHIPHVALRIAQEPRDSRPAGHLGQGGREAHHQGACRFPYPFQDGQSLRAAPTMAHRHGIIAYPLLFHLCHAPLDLGRSTARIQLAANGFGERRDRHHDCRDHRWRLVT